MQPLCVPLSIMGANIMKQPTHANYNDFLFKNGFVCYDDVANCNKLQNTIKIFVLCCHPICDNMQLFIICNYVLSFLQLLTILLNLLFFSWLWCNYKIEHVSILTNLLDFSSKNIFQHFYYDYFKLHYWHIFCQVTFLNNFMLCNYFPLCCCLSMYFCSSSSLI
jgi:hypothetical protein